MQKHLDMQKHLINNKLKRKETRRGEKGSQANTMTNQTFGGARKSRRHPFVDGILEVEIPLRWKGLTRDRYNGIVDPDEHVDIFMTQMGLYTFDNAIFCRLFPTSLKGLTLNWLTQMPLKSINFFETFNTFWNIVFYK